MQSPTLLDNRAVSYGSVTVTIVAVVILIALVIAAPPYVFHTLQPGARTPVGIILYDCLAAPPISIWLLYVFTKPL